MTYPDNCLKGIPNSQFLIDDGSVASSLFHFKKEYERDDGWIEQSINWEDDNSVVEMTQNQKKENGEIQFKVGVARLPKCEIDRINQQPTVNGILSYERFPLENNKHHGNLLIRSGTPTPTMKKIAAGLALAVSEVIIKN
jgi:hypothetical protein